MGEVRNITMQGIFIHCVERLSANDTYRFLTPLMFNSPPGLSDAMDLAKMLAMLDIIAPLAAEDFRIWRQTRTGLLSYPLQIDAARAHLATSVYVQMAVQPHIVHVVSYTEADHAATADDVIESCQLARRAIENALRGAPDLTADPNVQARRAELVQQAQITLAAIAAIADRDVGDPFIDPGTLARAVQVGILDAPQLRQIALPPAPSPRATQRARASPSILPGGPGRSKIVWHILLRIDNADLRLTPVGREVGLVQDDRWARFVGRKDRLHRNLASLRDGTVRSNGASIPAVQRLRQPGIRLSEMLERGEISLDVDAEAASHDISTAETIVKDHGYLKRQQADVVRSRQNETRPIPRGFTYEKIPGLSREMVQRFGEVEPATLGQAGRIPGVTPAAVAVLGAYLERFSHDATGVQREAGEESPEGEDQPGPPMQ